jgi:hypothetical protein
MSPALPRQEPTPGPLTSGHLRIEVRRDLDAMYWCRLFDVSPQELRRAVQQVGPQVSAVQRYLCEHHGHGKGSI